MALCELVNLVSVVRVRTETVATHFISLIFQESREKDERGACSRRHPQHCSRCSQVHEWVGGMRCVSSMIIDSI